MGGATVSVGGALVGGEVASTVGTGVAVGSGGGVGLGGGGAAIVNWIGASTVSAISTLGTATGVSVSGCCVGAEELGSVGDVVAEPHPITKMTHNVSSNAVKRCILTPPNMALSGTRSNCLKLIRNGSCSEYITKPLSQVPSKPGQRGSRFVEVPHPRIRHRPHRRPLRIP